MTTPPSKTSITVTKTDRERLRRFKEDGHFAEMLDAYRFAFALALSRGVPPPPLETDRVTVFGVTTLDPDGSMAAVAAALQPDPAVSPYVTVEKLAEWGLQELEMLVDEHGSLPLQDLVDRLAEAEGGGDA